MIDSFFSSNLLGGVEVQVQVVFENKSNLSLVLKVFGVFKKSVNSPLFQVTKARKTNNDNQQQSTHHHQPSLSF